MSIRPMRRITLCGLIGEKMETLEALQALGVAHLIPMRDAGTLTPSDPAQLNRTRTAYRHLTEAPSYGLPYGAGAPFDLEAIVAEVLHNRARLRTLRDRRDALQKRIDDLAPWGDLHLPPLADVGGQRLWFYALPIAERAALERVDLPWQILRKGTTTLYLAVISPDEPPSDLLPVPRVHTGAVPRSVLKRELQDTLIATEQAEAARVELTRWRLRIGAHLAAAADKEDLRAAVEQTLDQDRVFAVQGWVPQEKVEAVEAFAAVRRLALVVEAPAPGDKPPTLLAPPEGAATGADLTFFYTSPGYRSWDPSLVVFASFAVFFAMIMADAGYAALLVLATLVFWRRMGQTPAGRRGRTLAAALSGAAFVYGIACGSYFGLKPPEGSLLAAVAVIEVNDFDQMMLIAIGVGALHITIALGMVAWLNRRTGPGLTALGWIACIWSGMLLWQGEGRAIEVLASLGIGGGLVAVFIGAAMQHPVSAPRDWVRRLGAGAMALTGATKLFGDLLSYLRLFALGLASASLAGTFNALAVDMRATHPGLGVLLAILILALGHGINFLLALMSGVVHGLRLNFIEFFGWGLTEEGYPFRAFSKRETPL